MKMTSVALACLGLVTSVALVGCGGGAGGESTAQVQTGVFVDSPVQGMNYRTTTQSGTTNAQGEFGYVSGENVTFSL
jgi:hypothetical protein